VQAGRSPVFSKAAERITPVSVGTSSVELIFCSTLPTQLHT
jgi:hypothetical protein